MPIASSLLVPFFTAARSMPTWPAGRDFCILAAQRAAVPCTRDNVREVTAAGRAMPLPRGPMAARPPPFGLLPPFSCCAPPTPGRTICRRPRCAHLQSGQAWCRMQLSRLLVRFLTAPGGACRDGARVPAAGEMKMRRASAAGASAGTSSAGGAPKGGGAAGRAPQRGGMLRVEARPQACSHCAGRGARTGTLHEAIGMLGMRLDDFDKVGAPAGGWPEPGAAA